MHGRAPDLRLSSCTAAMMHGLWDTNTPELQACVGSVQTCAPASARTDSQSVHVMRHEH